MSNIADNTTIIILAGGKSTRMGRNKLDLLFEGETLLERAYRKFSAEFTDVRVSIAGGIEPPSINARFLPDLLPGRGPLSGLYSALTAVKGGVFLAAADMPFAPPDAARKIIELSADYEAAAVIKDSDRLETLFAYYSPAALPLAEAAITDSNPKMYKLQRILQQLHTKKLTLTEVASNPQILLNVNYPEDYERLVNSDLT
jgi:molybdopterin-guanine dinucleotide biosynthesis protein A